MEDNKKWMHKETERQRRQEMTNLCSSLRSLLPLEYIKGKRSISDHVNEAINYINHLQNKVKQLEAKKEDLIKVSSLNKNIPQNGSSSTSSTNLQPFVIVQPFPGGLEIVCSYTSKKCLFPLSRVLDMMLKEGLNVISSNCNKIDGRFIFTIRSEDPIMSGIDYSQLQRKLIDAILSSSSLQESSSEPGIHNILR
ncbi:basic helix-loop-helix (bHLH) DNA-binding superfamily protein [Trifolium repens]|nr:basic helix-loop-helix (bHLH) DNA-binding superfamily protein [Trifolium repens]